MRDHGVDSDRKILPSHVVVVPTGMYLNYGRWIKKEINGVNEKNKTILDVNHWRQLRSSSVVLQAANRTAG